MSELPAEGPEELVELVSRLRELRAGAGRPLREIAERAGVPRSSLYHVFSGKRLPSLENLITIVDALLPPMPAETHARQRLMWVELWQAADAAVRARRTDEAAAVALRGTSESTGEADALRRLHEENRRLNEESRRLIDAIRRDAEASADALRGTSESTRTSDAPRMSRRQIEAMRSEAEAYAYTLPSEPGRSPALSANTADETVPSAIPDRGNSAEPELEGAAPEPSKELILARDSSVSSALVVTGLRALRQEADAARAAALEAQRQASELEARIAALEAEAEDQHRRIEALLAELSLAEGERYEGE
ncbi:helix-turn-helix domain-containing protein [Streptomyces sp. NPDC056463]|uniref:helix-turn-helix domain-containing protein n=1 Tax=Streptomyces sp. NPDC056463 TaxID=3345827 RepID=UPI0036BAE122